MSLDKVSQYPFPGNIPQQSPSPLALADPPNVGDSPPFKMNERVMVYDKKGKEVFGRVRWCGDGNKRKHFGFLAMGIETVSCIHESHLL